MAYGTSTIASANPSADLYTALATLLTTAGYTLVDTQVISTRTHKVWKSAAANNAAGKDFYLDFAYTTTGAGNLTVFPFEDYNATTHLASRGPIAVASSTVDATTFSYTGSTAAALESAAGGIHAGNASTGQQLVVTTASFGYWASITGDRVILMSSAEPSSVIYAGTYTPSSAYSATAGSALFPLIWAKLFSSFTSGGTSASSATASSASAALTRIAPKSAIGNWTSHVNVVGALGSAVNNLPQIPSGDTSMHAFAGVEVNVIGGASGTGTYGLFGKLIDVENIPAAATVSRGDTITIGASTYVVATPTSGLAVAFKAV
jgi:hypothetical protein